MCLVDDLHGHGVDEGIKDPLVVAALAEGLQLLFDLVLIGHGFLASQGPLHGSASVDAFAFTSSLEISAFVF